MVIWWDPQATENAPCIEWVEGLAVLMACLIVGSITALNNYKKELQFRALQSKQDDSRVTVWRSGNIAQVPVNEICVGDVVQLDTGAKIPAGAPPARMIKNESSQNTPQITIPQYTISIADGAPHILPHPAIPP
jgi:magnesium-transporting ATPase (P-type)